MDEKEWNMSLFKTMQELSDKYDIKLPPREHRSFLNTDDELPDRAFQAALDFIVNKGIYCLTSGRIIQFSEDEVRESIKETPSEIIIGEGKDTRTFKQRKVEGKEFVNIVPGHHAPFTEDLAPLVVKNFAQIPRTDFIEGFNFPKVEGREIYSMPMEAYASRKEAAWMREGVEMAGRPGLSIVLYPLSTKASSLISAIDQERGLRKTDGVLLTVLPDIKVEYDLLTAAMVYHDFGMYSVNGGFGIVGGFCGGPEGAIIEGIVKSLAGFLVYRDTVHYTGVEHFGYISGDKVVIDPINWARSVIYQAMSRNSSTICMEWNISCSGLCTEMALLESAIRSIEAPVNGANLYAPRVSRPMLNSGQTPLEPEFMVEVSDATIKAGLNREEASEILDKLSESLDGKPPAKGKTIQECYDLENHRPSEEYHKLYLNVKKKLTDLGLHFE